MALGTKNLKFDCSKHIIILAVTGTLIPSRVIEPYAAYCKDEAFKPAGEHLLYAILDVCSASMQKSFQSVDNVIAAGAQAFQNLKGVFHTLEENGLDENGGRLKLRPSGRQSGI